MEAWTLARRRSSEAWTVDYGFRIAVDLLFAHARAQCEDLPGQAVL
jgi:hypothetical protein